MGRGPPRLSSKAHAAPYPDPASGPRRVWRGRDDRRRQRRHERRREQQQQRRHLGRSDDARHGRALDARRPLVDDAGELRLPATASTSDTATGLGRRQGRARSRLRPARAAFASSSPRRTRKTWGVEIEKGDLASYGLHEMKDHIGSSSARPPSAIRSRPRVAPTGRTILRSEEPYEPIFGTDVNINPANTWAQYIYDVVPDLQGLRSRSGTSGTSRNR